MTEKKARKSVGGKGTEEFMNKWVGGYGQDVLYLFVTAGRCNYEGRGMCQKIEHLVSRNKNL